MKEEKPSTHNYKSNHLKFERAIDSVFIKEHWNASPHRFKIYKEILGVKRIPASVRAILNISLYKVYNVSEGSYKYESSFKDMKSYFKYFARDKFGLKRKLLRFIDRRFGKDSTIIFETLSYYKNIEEIDYFNEQRKEWTHPCYPEEKSSETFFELYEKAITRAVDLITKTYDFFTDENITTVDYGNLSYSTGKDCTDKTPMQYFNSIY